MTPLNKSITREVKIEHRSKPLIICIEPPSTIKIKEKGSRTWFTTTVEAVMWRAAEVQAEREMREKKARRGR